MMSSKAKTLIYLKPILKKSKIEKIYSFTIKDWQSNKKGILKNISDRFHGKIIVRSSAIGEDGSVSSQAGKYTSVLNINPKNIADVTNGINKVIRSYVDKSNSDDLNHNYKLHNIARPRSDFYNNEILIQNQTTSIRTSGVILSREPNSGSPYYIVNYDDGDKTDSVTKGISNDVIKIFRNIKKSLIPKKWRKLISAVKEIESIFQSENLDIEFCINKKNVIIIFQVRIMTQFLGGNHHLIDESIQQNLKKISNSISARDRVYLSDMSDWNPAEIIGSNPNPLSYSLYDYLIMNDSWCRGRMYLGYKRPISKKLMIKIGNKPYVNLINSFSSFFPNELPPNLSSKLLRYYLTKIQKNPHLHDKIEFSIVFSCYDFALSDRLRELCAYGFTKKQINQINSILQQFTNEKISNFNSILAECENLISKLETKRSIHFANYKNAISLKQYLELSRILLHDCKNFGIIPFVIIARLAFIATALLNSLHKKNFLNKDQYFSILNSIKSPMKEFQTDLLLLNRKKISKNTFLHKYGHLRPGTYDITISRYDKTQFNDAESFKPRNAYANVAMDIKKINQLLKSHNLNFDFTQLINFIQKTLYYREFFKLQFTKNISDSLDLISKAGKQIGFTANDLSFLTIDRILNYQKNIQNLKKVWRDEMLKNREKFSKNDLLILPPIITNKNNLYVIDNFRSRPNFITSKSITSDVIILKNNIADIENKIVVIENADPGFDWIFTKNPSGLVTKYGGVASHMAIRCYELNLPAMIGCEESIFSKITTSKKINLDCKNQRVILLR